MLAPEQELDWALLIISEEMSSGEKPLVMLRLVIMVVSSSMLRELLMVC